MARYFGSNSPFTDSRGVLARQEDVRLIKNDILQLLFTLPGERVHRPNFGTPLRRIIMDPLNQFALTTLERDIRVALDVEEPRIQNVVVTLSANPDKLTVEIRILGELSLDPNIKLELETSIAAPGVATR